MSEEEGYFQDSHESFGDMFKLNELYYNCTECPSHIDILSINEKESMIEFTCKNTNHRMKMPIKEYINKMKYFNNKNINDDTCKNHNKKYECYCIDCNKHLCKSCLKSGNHINHKKYILIEFEPNEKQVKEILNKINYYENQIENLEKQKLIKTKELNNKLKEAKDKLKMEKEKDEINIIIKENNENKNNL